MTRLKIALAEADRIESEIAEDERRKDEREMDRLIDLLAQPA